MQRRQRYDARCVRKPRPWVSRKPAPCGISLEHASLSSVRSRGPALSFAWNEPRGSRFEPSDKKSVDDLFADYSQAFIAKDYVKLRDCLQAPFVRVTGGEPNVVSTLD